MNITFEQAKEIIKSDKRLILDIFSETRVYFFELDDGDIELNTYNTIEDTPETLLNCNQLNIAKWELVGHYLCAYIDDELKWKGKVYIKPEAFDKILIH